MGVDYYANCSGVAPAYQVTINNCGNVSHFTGAFALGTDDQGDTGVVVTKFDFQPCNGSEVSGLATYDDYAQTPSGFATTAVPCRFARHRRSAPGKRRHVLTTGSTDESGAFDLRFTNTDKPGYYLKVIAANTQYVNQEVKNDLGVDWSIQVEPL